MLQKLLPYLKKLIPSLSKQTNNPKSIDDPLNLGLLGSHDYTEQAILEQKKIIHSSRVAIAFISSGFLILAGLNYYYDGKLAESKKTQDYLVSRLEALEEYEYKARDIESKVNYYKEIDTSRILLYPIIEYMFAPLDETVSVSVFDLSQDSFKLDFTVPDVFTFATILDYYLKFEKLTDITIKSASLDSVTGEYEISLEGNLRR